MKTDKKELRSMIDNAITIIETVKDYARETKNDVMELKASASLGHLLDCDDLLRLEMYQETGRVLYTAACDNCGLQMKPSDEMLCDNCKPRKQSKFRALSNVDNSADGSGNWKSSSFDSTGDAVQAAVNWYNLTEEQHQSLWDNLFIDLPEGGLRIEIEEVN
jgi:hypothetical protein